VSCFLASLRDSKNNLKHTFKGHGRDSLLGLLAALPPPSAGFSMATLRFWRSQPSVFKGTDEMCEKCEECEKWAKWEKCEECEMCEKWEANKRNQKTENRGQRTVSRT
jgi:hypothetical protein